MPSYIVIIWLPIDIQIPDKQAKILLELFGMIVILVNMTKNKKYECVLLEIDDEIAVKSAQNSIQCIQSGMCGFIFIQ